MADDTARLQAADLITAIKSAGIRFIVALPDRTTSEHLLKPMLADPELRVVQICKEDEGVSICSGLYAAGQRALLLMQYTGLLDSVNALRGVAMEGHNPVCMMVGLLHKEPGVLPAQSRHYGVRIVEPVLDAMRIVDVAVGLLVQEVQFALLVVLVMVGVEIEPAGIGRGELRRC